MADPADDEELTNDDIQGLIHPALWQAYQAEMQYIAARVQAARKAGESLIQKALTWVPYIDAVFEEQEIDVPAACSDVNRETRARLIIQRVEAATGNTLDAETRAHILADVRAMYDHSLGPSD
jgi:hypothetical protein